MIAVVDIGNTRTKCALFDASAGAADAEGGKSLQREISLATGLGLSAEVTNFFSGPITSAVIGSVVPDRNNFWLRFFTERGVATHLATAESPWGFRIGVENPARVGTDRLANMQAATAFPGAVVVVDAGTATKFDLLEGVGARAFAGGAIAPGVGISFEALLQATAQLPRIDLEKHSPVVGYDTETAMRSGAVHGFAALVDGMVMRIFEERRLPPGTSVVATGGYAPMLKGRARLVTHLKPHFTLEGLYGLAQKL